MLKEFTDKHNALSPSLIIFHVSRCGSTLLSQLLALDDTNIVLSEVPLFDTFLRRAHQKEQDASAENIHYLQDAINIYGTKQTGNEKQLIIKADSWHLHFYEELRNIFPLVPFVLLYRNPMEVLQSQQQQRGMHAVPGLIEPQIFGFSKEDLTNLKSPMLDVYFSNVLTGYYNKMMQIKTIDPNVLCVDYGEGMINIIDKITNFAHLHISAETAALFKERVRYNAKKPLEIFKDENKLLEIPAYLLTAISSYNLLNELKIV